MHCLVARKAAPGGSLEQRVVRAGSSAMLVSFLATVWSSGWAEQLDTGSLQSNAYVTLGQKRSMSPTLPVAFASSAQAKADVDVLTHLPIPWLCGQ